VDGVRITAAFTATRKKVLKRIKGERRPNKELSRKLRAMAAKITDKPMLDAFLNAVPERDRDRVAALIVPHVRIF
jgi:hypothetical protein